MKLFLLKKNCYNSFSIVPNTHSEIFPIAILIDILSSSLHTPVEKFVVWINL